MKNLIFLCFSVVLFVSCNDETTKIVDSSKPEGAFTAQKGGSFTEQNSTGTMGMVQLGTDSKGTQFLKLGSNFNTNLGTGTVTIYLSTTNDDLKNVFDPANGNKNIRLVGFVSKAGENYFKLDPAAESKFTYVILWCASAGIPFGYSPLN